MRLYEFSQDATSFYLVTEFCEGGELLNKIVRLQHFSERIAAKIMLQVLSAVAYCHSRQVVHRYEVRHNGFYRDLKPENLVLEGKEIDSNIKVIDFGTSAVFKQRERMREIMGTVYISAIIICRHTTLHLKCCSSVTQKNVTSGAAASFFSSFYAVVRLFREIPTKRSCARLRRASFHLRVNMIASSGRSTMETSVS